MTPAVLWLLALSLTGLVPVRFTAAQELLGSGSGDMVLIPAGGFRMGSSAGASDEQPHHTVFLDAYVMRLLDCLGIATSLDSDLRWSGGSKGGSGLADPSDSKILSR